MPFILAFKKIPIDVRCKIDEADNMRHIVCLIDFPTHINRYHFQSQIKGMVKWERNIRVKTHCDMDIVDFPYDSQSCPIVVSSQDNSNEYLKLSSDKWNRLNQVPEKQKIVTPNDTNTIKVSHQPSTLHQHYTNIKA